MELYQLKSFLAIVREQNLTRAADALHLSQSALSSQIKALEEELGLRLFKRSSRGMTLSQQGEVLLPQIQELIEAASRLRQQAGALSRGVSASVTIGLNADPTFLRVSAVNQRLALLHPGLNVIFLTSQSVQTAQMLRQGMIDIGLFYGDIQESDINHQVITQIRVCVAIPQRLVNDVADLDWSSVAELPWIWVGNDCPLYKPVQNRFERLKVIPNQTTTAIDEQIVRELVMAGQGVAMMREDEARSLEALGKIVIWEQGWSTIPLSLGWLTKKANSDQVRAAREAIGYVWRESEGVVEDGLGGKYWV